MASKWFCKLGDRQYGPLSVAQLQKMVQRGQITPSSLLRREDKEDWTQASRIKGLLPNAAPPADAAPPAPKTQPASAKPARAKHVQTKPAPQRATPVASSPSQALPPARPAAPKAATPVYVDSPKPQTAIVADPETPTYARRRNSSVTMLLTVGAVLCGVVVLAAITYFALGVSDDVTASDGAVAANNANSVSSSAAASNAGNAQSTPDQTNSRPAASAGVESVEKWYDASKATVGKGNVRVKVASVWIADSLGEDATASAQRTGNRQGTQDDVIDILGDDVRKSPSDEIADEEQTSKSNEKSSFPRKGKYVFIQVSVMNKGADESINYLSWNGDTTDVTSGLAELVDNHGQVYEMVPRTELESDERLRKVWVEPAKSATDVLVFNSPKNGFASLKLVLPYAAVEKTGVMGFEIAAESVRGSRRGASSIPSSKPAPAVVTKNNPEKPSIDPIIRGISEVETDDAKADATAPAVPKKPAVDKPVSKDPPTIEELNRQFKDFNNDDKGRAKPNKSGDK